MVGYLLKRLALLVPVLIGVSLVTFMLTKALPGDPVQGMVGERASAETIERIRHELGQDKGAAAQYMGYLKLIAQGELGRSYYTNRSVRDDLINKFPNTLMLALAAMGLAVPVGIMLGYTAAAHQGRALDRVISSVSVLGMSVPVFWSGLLLMLFFSFTLKLLPPSGMGGVSFMVLPALTLSLPAIATVSRITRASVAEVMHMPYVQTARAKGLAPSRIARGHVLRNALIPIVTVIGLDFGSYLNGAVLTETIFGWDGIGRYLMEGILKRDYPVVMGGILLGTVVFVLVNLAVDMMYLALDPRVRLQGSKEGAQ